MLAIETYRKKRIEHLTWCASMALSRALPVLPFALLGGAFVQSAVILVKEYQWAAHGFDTLVAGRMLPVSWIW